MKLLYIFFIIIAAGCASNDSYVTKNELSDYKTEQNNRFDLAERASLINIKSIDENRTLIENNNIIIEQNFGDIDMIFNELTKLTSDFNKLDSEMIDYIWYQGKSSGTILQVR